MLTKHLFLLWFLLASCSPLSSEPTPTDRPKDKPPRPYTEFLATVKSEQACFASAYNSESGAQNDSVIDAARAYLLTTITDSLFSYWYDTPWDFNGHTSTPGQGQIACGYFVTTVLQDAGFNLPRYKWAQQYAQYYIKRLAPQDMMQFSNAPLDQVTDALIKQGTGLYVVGLDNHTGFVWVADTTVQFVHSNYYQPEIGVMAEDIDSENPLKNSAYRLFGKLLSDDMVRNWILGTTYH